MCFAPSSPMLLKLILRARAKRTRQGALTVGERACGGVLELGEGLIDGKGLRNVPCALCTDAVVEQTASESQTETSGGADSRETMRGSVLERLEGVVRLQALRKMLSGLGIEVVARQTANRSRNQSSAGIDT